MKKKKGGFTLIETIVSISIVVFIFTSAASLAILNKNIEKEIKYDSDIYEIQNLLTLGKAKCRKENIEGEVSIDAINNEMYLYSYGRDSNSLFRKIELSDDSSYAGKGWNIHLDDRGRFLSGKTIFIRNSDEIKDITIGVGVDTIRIKD